MKDLKNMILEGIDNNILNILSKLLHGNYSKGNNDENYKKDMLTLKSNIENLWGKKSKLLDIDINNLPDKEKKNTNNNLINLRKLYHIRDYVDSLNIENDTNPDNIINEVLNKIADTNKSAVIQNFIKYSDINTLNLLCNAQKNNETDKLFEINDFIKNNDNVYYYSKNSLSDIICNKYKEKEFVDYNINKNLINNLSEITGSKSTISIGKFEILLRLFLNGAYNAYANDNKLTGDVNLMQHNKNIILEIKGKNGHPSGTKSIKKSVNYINSSKSFFTNFIKKISEDKNKFDNKNELQNDLDNLNSYINDSDLFKTGKQIKNILTINQYKEKSEFINFINALILFFKKYSNNQINKYIHSALATTILSQAPIYKKINELFMYEKYEQFILHLFIHFYTNCYESIEKEQIYNYINLNNNYINNNITFTNNKLIRLFQLFDLYTYMYNINGSIKFNYLFIIWDDLSYFIIDVKKLNNKLELGFKLPDIITGIGSYGTGKGGDRKNYCEFVTNFK